jgi:hypothetical protein
VYVGIAYLEAVVRHMLDEVFADELTEIVFGDLVVEADADNMVVSDDVAEEALGVASDSHCFVMGWGVDLCNARRHDAFKVIADNLEGWSHLWFVGV